MKRVLIRMNLHYAPSVHTFLALFSKLSSILLLHYKLKLLTNYITNTRFVESEVSAVERQAL